MEYNKEELTPELKDRSELSLNNMKKWDLIRYIRKLEEIISKYEFMLSEEIKIKEESISYIESHTYCERTKKHSYDLMNREVKELLKTLRRKYDE